MFGLIRPCLQGAEKEEYKSYYCGLCMGMGRCTGMVSRFLVNYDVCLAYLLADSIGCESTVKEMRCPYMPYKKVTYRDNPTLLNWMAEINYMLSYHKVLDDVYDDDSWKAKVVAGFMRKRYTALAEKHGDIDQAMAEKMALLRVQEGHNEAISIKDAATPFGELLEASMGGCFQDELDGEVFALLCKQLGMWIYIVDACLDLEKDSQQQTYNPILAGTTLPHQEALQERKREILTTLMELRQTMVQLLQLLSSEKNEDLIQTMFQRLLPQNVAEMLQ